MVASAVRVGSASVSVIPCENCGQLDIHVYIEGSRSQSDRST